MKNKISTIVMAIVVGGCMLSAGVTKSHACGNYVSSSQCHNYSYQYKWITVNEARRVAYTKYVVRYYQCGTPYIAKVTCYKTIYVAVRKRIKIYR